MSEAIKCPVCDGKGLVPNGYYSAIGVDSWTSASTTPEECKSCDGKGYIIIPTTTIEYTL